jgi:hypothetical protein
MQIMQNCRSLWLSACSMPRPTVEQPRSISFLVALLDSNGHKHQFDRLTKRLLLKYLDTLCRVPFCNVCVSRLKSGQACNNKIMV